MAETIAPMTPADRSRPHEGKASAKSQWTPAIRIRWAGIILAQFVLFALLFTSTCTPEGSPPVQSSSSASQPPVTLHMPSSPMYIGTFEYVAVDIDPSSPLAFEDLEFEVAEGPQAGIASNHPEPLFSGSTRRIILGAGSEPGSWTLHVKEASSGAILTADHFEVTNSWSNRDEGPSYWFQGVADEPVFGSAWGGGPASIQNTEVLAPVEGDWDIVAVSVRAADSLRQPLSPEQITSAIVQPWTDWINNYANQYFLEQSYGQLNVQGIVLDTQLTLPSAFEDYYFSSPFGPIEVNFSSRPLWAPTDELAQAVISMTDDVVDWSGVETLLILGSRGPRTIDYPWPYAWGGNFKSNDGDVNLRYISMNGLSVPSIDNPSDPYRRQTLVHELGHNFGMWDLFFPDLGRSLAGTHLELMAGQAPAGLSLFHRLMLGWVDESHVESIRIAETGGIGNQLVTLSPLNRPPSPGDTLGVEIRIADGHNYYISYRLQDSQSTFDKPNLNAAVMTDTIMYSLLAGTIPDPAGNVDYPVYAPPVQEMRPQADGDPDPNKPSEFLAGDDYEEYDLSDPTAPAAFRLAIENIDSTVPEATVRLNWDLVSPLPGGTPKPDPSIRPWPSDDAQYRSPDIQVRNAMNWDETTQSWINDNNRNRPWEDNLNTIVATVRNSTRVTAEDVEVHFHIKDFTISGAPLSYIGTDIQDIPSGGEVEFSVGGWVPGARLDRSASVHYCVVVQIAPYNNSPNGELSTDNNFAQSNYASMISKFASPHTRDATLVRVMNPFDKETYAYIRPSQDNPLYRTFVEYRWLKLAPNETRTVRVASEFAGEEYLRDGGDPEVYQRNLGLPNRLDVTGTVLTATNTSTVVAELQNRPTGGVSIRVVQGAATQVDVGVVDSTNFDYVLGGGVSELGTGQPVGVGHVVLAFRSGGSLSYVRTDVNPVGQYHVSVPAAGWTEVVAHYSSAPGFAESRSNPLQNPSQ